MPPLPLVQVAHERLGSPDAGRRTRTPLPAICMVNEGVEGSSREPGASLPPLRLRHTVKRSATLGRPNGLVKPFLTLIPWRIPRPRASSVQRIGEGEAAVGERAALWPVGLAIGNKD